MEYAGGCYHGVHNSLCKVEGFTVSDGKCCLKRDKALESGCIDNRRQALEACVEMEEAVKTGKIKDIMSVELLIVRYSA